MAGTQSVHQCLFCSQTFDNAIAKDEHILEHFAQETCTGCDQNLIRIGGSFYTKHDPMTCIKQGVKIEEHAESCFTETLIVQNETESNHLSYANDVNYCAMRQSDDKPVIEQINTFQDLNDYQSYMPNVKWDESGEQAICASVSTVSLVETAIKMEPIEQSFPNQNQTVQILAEKDKVERTRKSRKTDNDIYCDACSSKFKSDTLYRQHMLHKHGVTINFTCEHCNVDFTQQALFENHRCSNSNSSADNSGDKRNACNICGKKFNHKSSVYRHKSLVHAPPDTIICNVCGRRFDDGTTRDAHREECVLKYRQRKSASSGELECNFCKRKFRLDESLRRHIRLKHDVNVEKFQCELCKVVFMKESSLNAHTCPKRSQYSCDLCGRKLSNARTLQTHKILLHSPPGTIFCNICSKLFATTEERDKHKLECSLRSKMYKLKSNGRFECDLCHAKVGTKGNLRQHMRRKHDPNAENFRCKSCRTIFMNEHSLEHHQCKGKPTNASQRLLTSCELCGKVLQKCALARHKLLKHRAPDSIFCRTCIKIFPSIDDLNAHLPHCKKSIRRACNICNKILANPRVLARHKISLHSAPGTIFCKTCVKKFKTIEELNVHMPECTLKRKLQKFQKQSQMSDDCIK